MKTLTLLCIVLLLPGLAIAANLTDLKEMRKNAHILEAEIISLPSLQRNRRLDELTQAYRAVRDAFKEYLLETPDSAPVVEPILAELNSKIYWSRKLTPLQTASQRTKSAASRKEIAAAKKAFNQAEADSRKKEFSKPMVIANYRYIARTWPNTFWGLESASRASVLTARSVTGTPISDATAEAGITAFGKRLPELIQGGRISEAIEEWEALRRMVPASSKLSDAIDLGGIKLHLVDQMYSRAYGNAFENQGVTFNLETTTGEQMTGRIASVDETGISVDVNGLKKDIPFFKLGINSIIRLALADGSPGAALSAGATLMLLEDFDAARVLLEAAKESEPLAKQLLKEIGGTVEDVDATSVTETKKQKKQENRKADRALKSALRSHKKNDWLKTLQHMDKFLDAVDDEDLAYYAHEQQDPTLYQIVFDARTLCDACEQEHKFTCSNCKGKGKIVRKRKKMTCPDCNGKGQLACDECADRFGDKGHIAVQDRIQAAMPSKQ